MSDRWTAAAVVALTLSFLIMAIGSAQAAPTPSPTSITVEELEPGDNESRAVTISVTGSDNFSAVRILVVGDTALDEAALQDMVTVYPTYFSTLDNTENKTFTVNVMNVGYDGIYTGDIVISHSSGDTHIPLSVDAGENVPEITGLIPSFGTIAVTMTALDSIERELVIYNRTAYNLTSFDAYMKDTQLYGGLDWIDIEFDAPYILKIDNYTTVSVTIDPSEVPDNEYRRTMVVSAYHGMTRVYAEIDLKITIYGGNNLIDQNVEIVINPLYPLVGENMYISLSHAVEADIWIGANYVGKTNDNGQLTTSITVGGEYEAMAMVGGRSVATEMVTIREQKVVTIHLDTVEISVGDILRGVIMTATGEPVERVLVTINSTGDSKSAYTDSAGRFSIPTMGLDSGPHEISTQRTTIGHISYGSASADIVIVGHIYWLNWAAAGIVAVLIFLAIVFRRDLIREKAAGVMKKVGVKKGSPC